MDVPKQSGMVSRTGNIGIAAHWDLLWNGKRIPCGFFQGYDQNDQPIYKPLKFNYGADKFLYGDNPEDCNVYELLQVHPQYKNRVSGPPSKQWVCELDIAEAVSSSEVDKFLARQKVENRVANLNQTELDVLMETAKYGMGFLSRPDAKDNSTVARSIIVSELLKAGGAKRVGDLIEKMDKALEIATLHDIFSNQKLTLVGRDLFDEKAVKIHSFTDSFKGQNAEEQAIWLYEKMGKIVAIKEAIEAIKAYKKK